MVKPHFRFIARGPVLDWVHEALIQPGDVDCTEMDDLAFEQQVCRSVGIFNFCTVPA